ncbi:MAG: tRNA (adenine(22)-N(1))-methyltransferase TrmK, partial [Tetragenococcus halophilus]|nr:tRNA (adenine(22)-N(1))-methyltransferase TrmK [Tetragenococcus halophilus]
HYTSKELYFGPVLMQKKTASFKKKWQKKLETKQKVLRNLKNAYRVPKDKIEAEKRQTAWIEEVLS